jgi:hypothetical protein
MKKMLTLKYIKVKVAQLRENEILDILNKKHKEVAELPTITPQNINNILEDSFEKDIEPRIEPGNIQPIQQQVNMLPEDTYEINTMLPEKYPEVEREEINFDAIDNIIEHGVQEEEKNQQVNPVDLIQKSEPQKNNVGKVVKIWYETKSGKDIEREIEPHGQFMAKSTGNNILVAFDRTVGDIRAFIMKNILWTEVTDNNFNRKFNISLG